MLCEAIVIGTLLNSVIFAIVFTCVMLLYMDVGGESLGRFSMRAELIDEKSDASCRKVIQAFSVVKSKTEIQFPFSKQIRIYYIPTEEINAYSFGRNSIAITRGAMSLDSKIIEAILSHEVGHSINADMYFYRFLFGNLFTLIFLIGIWNAVIIAILIIIGGLIFALSALRLNFVTYQISSFLVGCLKNLLNGIQNILLSIGQAIIACVSRKSEYNADEFAHSLGYNYYLQIFLSKYAMDFEAFHPRTIPEILYASHPEPIRRINHLKSIEQK